MADALADLLKGVKESPQQPQQQEEQPPTSRSILPMNRGPIQQKAFQLEI